MWWTSKSDHFLVAAVFSTYSNIKTRNDFLHFPNMIFHFITRTSVNILFRFSFVATRRHSSPLIVTVVVVVAALAFIPLATPKEQYFVSSVSHVTFTSIQFLSLLSYAFNFSFVRCYFFVCFCCSKIDKTHWTKLSNEIAHRWRYTSSTQRWTMKQNKKRAHTKVHASIK